MPDLPEQDASADPSDFDRWARLLATYFDGDAPDSMPTEMEQALEAHPEFRRLFVEIALQRVALQRMFRGEVAEESPPQLSDAASSVVLARPASTTPGLSRPVIWSVLAAGVLFAAYFVGVSWNMLGRKLPNGTDGNDITVALISDTQDARWSPDSSPLSTRGRGVGGEGAAITQGERLQITSGLVELQLKQGTTLIVEGPAEWSIDGDNNATLNRGKLIANVPQQAIGFTLATPTATIIDLGTEFGVEVKTNGAADVHVVKGQIDVKRAGNSSKPGPGTLRAGQSVHITAEGSKVENNPVVPEKFKRLFAAGESKASSAAKPGATEGSVVVTLQQGKVNPLIQGPYTGCRDVQLISWGPDNNFGKRTNFDVGSVGGPANSVLRFDLTPLAGKFAKITGARLILNQDPLVSVRAPGVVNLHLLAVANRDWVEGNGVSAPPPSKDGATWNQRKPGARWAGASGASMAGKDYDPRLLAHHDYEARFFNKPFVFEIEGDLKFLADWANDDATNAGFLLRNGAEKTANNRITFYSCDFPDGAARPSLEIEYEPIEPEDKP